MPEVPHSEKIPVVLKIPRWRKGRWIYAARAEGLTLFAWIVSRLDSAADSVPGVPPAPLPPSPDHAPEEPQTQNP